MASKKGKAYSYLRFSTPDQLKGDSLRRQTKLAEDYARSHGLVLDNDLNLRDLGVSAFRGDNVATGALGAFLNAVKEGLVPAGSFLLVESLDRVSRKTARKAVRILEDIVEAGITVVTLNDGKQYTEESLDGFDFLMAVLILIRAHEESATKARRLKAAWHGKRLKAKETALTASTPGWIELDSKRKPVLIEDRAKVVRRIVKDYMQGTGKHSIVTALNKEAVPPFGRAAHWHRSYIDKILSSPALVGTFVPHIDEHVDGKAKRIPQEPVHNYFPAVIDEETFARLQELNSRSPLRGRHAKTSMRNILSGLARCPECSATMTRVSKGSRKKAGKPFLVCTKAKTGAGCVYLGVPIEDVEKALLKDHEQIIREMPHQDADTESELQDAQTLVDALEFKVGGLLDLLERRPSDSLAKRVASLEVQLKDARQVRDEVASKAQQTEKQIVQRKADNLAVAMRAKPLNRERINAALRELLEGVTVDYTSGHLRFHWRAGGQTALFFMWPAGVSLGRKAKRPLEKQ